MTTTPEPLKIFVSHATADDDIVTRIHDTLEAETGADIWVDHKDIGPGDIWELEIEANLKSRPLCLVCISKDSVKSLEVRAEWRGAISYGHQLLLAVVDDIEMNDIPIRLKLHQIVWVSKTNPGEGIAKLAHAIRKAAGISEPDDTPSFTSVTKITGTIPRNLTRIAMQGRESDLEKVRAGLAAGDITTINGVGGLGKSRLAAEVVANSDIKGIVWHRIDELKSAETVVSLLRENLNLPATTERDDAIKQFGEENRLLVLDNGEDATGDRLTEYVVLADELNRAGAQVLITSRVRWPGLKDKFTRFITPQTLPIEEATNMVAEVMAAYNITVDVDHQELAKKARQHPWLIEWSVKQMDETPVSVVMDMLESLQGYDEIEEAVKQMIHKTVDLMAAESAESKTLLKWVTVFRGGFTLDAAEYITQSSGLVHIYQLLKTLQKYAFVSFDANAQRYSVDPFVLEVIETNLDAHRPHYVFYRLKAQQHRTSTDHMTYANLDVESDNLEAAFEWALTNDDDDALWLMNECGDFMVNRGRFQRDLDWAQRVVRKLETRPDKTLWAAAQNSLGIRYCQYPLGNKVNNLQAAITAYEQALRFYTEEAAPLQYAATQNNLGNAYEGLARYQQPEENLQAAITAQEQALRFYTEEAAPLQYANTQNNLGNAYQTLAQYQQPEENLQAAITAYDRALHFYIEEDAPLQYANMQNNLANVYQTLAQYQHPEENMQKSITAYEQALRFYTEEAAPLQYANTQNNLGNAYSKLARFRRPEENLQAAITAHEQALRFYTEETAPLQYANTQNSLGVTYRILARYQQPEENMTKAIIAYEQALRFRTSEAAPLDYAMTKANIGSALKHLGRIDEAIAAWRETERIFRQMGFPDADKIKAQIEFYENPGD